MTDARREHGFTLVELLVVIAVIGILVGVLLPALSSARTSARQLKNSTQLREIHRGCVTFGISNDGWFPGRDSQGALVGLSSEKKAPSHEEGDVWEARIDSGFFTAPLGDGGLVTTRFAIMLKEELVTPEILVSPGDPIAEVADPTVGVLNLDLEAGPPNHSYAGLEQIGAHNDPGLRPEQRDRLREWRATDNHMAVLFADRCIEATPHFNPQPYYSIWTDDPGPGGANNYHGTVVRGDNSTTFERSHIISDTKYGTGKIAPKDDIFSPIDQIERGIYGDAMLVWN